MSEGVALKDLKTQQKNIQSEMSDLMENAFKATREKMGETDKGVLYIDAQLEGDDKTKYNNLLAEWKLTQNSIKILEAEIDDKRVKKTEDEIHGKYWDFVEQKAKINAKLAEDIIKVGRNKYQAEDIVWDETLASTLCIDAPFIEMGTDGVNRVMPFRPIYKSKEESKNREVDIHATYRQAEIYASGMAGKFDPITGLYIEGNPSPASPASAAPQTTAVTEKAIPDLSIGLYRYLITMNKIVRYCDVRQVSGLNTHWVNRRTQIPEGVIVDPRTSGGTPYGGEGFTLSEKKLTYDAIGIDLWKYGFIMGYTFESEYAVKDWSVPGQILMDGGTALSNILGKHVMIGDGVRKPMGIVPSIATANQKAAGAHGTFLSATGNTYKRPELIKLMTGQTSQAYFEMGNYYLFMNKNTWGNFISIEDGSGRAAFLAYGSRANSITPGQIFTGESVMLDQNIDDIASGKQPLVYADPMGHVVMLADGMRIDFSKEWGFAEDVLAYRFIQFAGAAQVDPNLSYSAKLS